MLTFPGISIQTQIYESANSLVYRAIRNKDNQSIILKVLKEDYPTPQELARYRTEYEITKSLTKLLNLPGVVKVYDLEKYQNTLVMFMEDFGGESLRIFMHKRTLTLTEFLTIAIKTTETLGQIHAANIIHKDINPSNIVFNPESGEIKIIDFGISTKLNKENPTITNPNILEGTLAYISPEQTGRMNRSLDYRTDFYSLGVTFYELLTNQLPFSTNDYLELVHCHIAKQPLHPHFINSDIPESLGNIIIKLIAKTAEERYQSALGIKTDLQECLSQLENYGTISNFPIANNDISDKFQLPEKLYGRQAEINQLLTAFAQVNNHSKMILIGGYSGIGKTSLVREIYKPITEKRGYFISGKFDQYQKNIPYSAFVTAFQSLVKQLLTESKQQLQIWKEKILTAVGNNGQIIIEVIPEVEFIIGKQPEISEIGINEAQNRFNLVFQNFIKVFTKPEHPLVLFIDDLQWCDTASLKLIELLMNDSLSGLFLIGAYRDNEVTGGHPLTITLANMRNSGIDIETIFLSPLKLLEINQLVAETLKQSPEKTYSLAELVQNKTGGNPFFMNEFLKSLYDEKLLTFAYQQGKWDWNLQKIQSLGITDNLVELMANKIQKLPENTAKLLTLAACIGNKFDLNLLANVTENSLQQTAIYLQDAMREGLLIPLSDNYKLAELDVSISSSELIIEYQFIHDRVQQAAYLLMSEEEQQTTHWKIGRILLKHIPVSEQEEKIFDLVNQLNLGRKLISLPSEKYAIANFNLIAAKKAVASTAYEPALCYLNMAMELLGTDGWDECYDLTLKVYQKAAKAAYLSGKFAQMDQMILEIKKQGKTLLDQVTANQIQILSYKTQNKSLDAIAIALDNLQLFGEKIPSKPQKYHVLIALMQTKLALLGKNIEQLVDLPIMTNVDKQTVMELIASVSSAAYTASPQTMLLLICKQVNLTIKYGNTPNAAFAYATYGLIQCSIVGNMELGAKFGKLAIALMERFNTQETKTKTLYIINSFIRHWSEPAKLSAKSLLEIYQSGIETGDLQFTAYAAYIYSYYSYFIGKQLFNLEQEIASLIESPIMKEQFIALYNCQLCRQVALNLMGECPHTYNLDGPVYYEEEMVSIYQQTNYITGLVYIYIHKMILCYLFENYEESFNYAQLAKKYLASVIGLMFVPVFNFYESLTQLALYSHDQKHQKTILKIVKLNQKKMKKWANSAQQNYQHKFYLVEAEISRILGQEYQAMKLYEQAISVAKENEYIQEAAISYELAAKFYLSINQELTAKAYMQEARYFYQFWGAIAKVKDLEKKYSQLLTIATPQIKTTQTIITSTNSGANLDLATVMKSSQAISGEINLDKLLSNLMKILIENAGAETGYLILNNQDKFVIEATGNIKSQEISVLQSLPLETCELISPAIVNYVARTQETVVLNNAKKEGNFTNDNYVKSHNAQSILCFPLINQGQLVSIIYLENNLTTGAFTPQRLQLLQLLSGQAAISIQNAKLYAQVKENESRLNQFLEAIPVGIGIVNAQGKPYYMNRVAKSLLNKEVISQATSEQIPQVYRIYKANSSEEYPSENLTIVRALHGESVKADDMEIHQENRIIPIESFSNPIYNTQGEIEYAMVAFQDITERKKAEAEREKFTQELYQLNQAYQRFVPSQFLHILEKSSILDVKLGDQIQLEMSVLFSDIRDFTMLSEQMTPEDNFKFINAYLSRMETPITDNHGFIDKYIGDAIMALFSGEADNAVKAGIAMLNQLSIYNQHRASYNYPPVEIGIGINTGSLILGTVGGKNRMDGTVISDAVNLASRVESLTKNYGVALLITQQTYQKLQYPENYHLRIIDTVKVKGKSQAVTVYEVFDADTEEIKTGKLATLSLFSQALSLYNQGNFIDAGKLFYDCLIQNPGDRVSYSYAQRCQQYPPLLE